MRAARPPGLLVLAVLGLHLLVGHEVQRIHEGWISEGPPPSPKRMQVEFVQEMVMQEPPAARVAPPAAAREAGPQAGSRAGPGASRIRACLGTRA